MRLDCALLCDAVTVREGLLHILGGGVTRTHRQSFPAPLSAALAFHVTVDRSEADMQHTLDARLIGESGEEVGVAHVDFTAQPSGRELPDEALSVSIPVPLYTIPLPKPGPYRFEVAINGEHLTSLHFVAEELPADPDAPAS